MLFVPQVEGPSEPDTQKKSKGGSNWLKALQKESTKKEQLGIKDKDARIARLAQLFQETDDDDLKAMDNAEDKLDQMAANVNLDKFLAKVDHHLEIEKVLIDDWDTQQKKRFEQDN